MRLHNTFVQSSRWWELPLPSNFKGNHWHRRKSHCCPPCCIAVPAQNPSLINYADPTFNMTMCTDPVRKAQLQQEAVSRYITTHHMDTYGWGTDFEIMLLASLLRFTSLCQSPQIHIFSCSTHGDSRQWVCYAPGFTRNRSTCPYGIYVYNIEDLHYHRVIPVMRSQH